MFEWFAAEFRGVWRVQANGGGMGLADASGQIVGAKIGEMVIVGAS